MSRNIDHLIALAKATSKEPITEEQIEESLLGASAATLCLYTNGLRLLVLDASCHRSPIHPVIISGIISDALDTFEALSKRVVNRNHPELEFPLSLDRAAMVEAWEAFLEKFDHSVEQ